MEQRDIALFDEQGFLKVGKGIAVENVQKVGACVDAAIHRAIAAYRQGKPFSRFAVTENDNGVYITRINDALRSVGAEVMAIVGHPLIVAIAKALCGGDAIPIYESVVVRTQGDDGVIAWHQDMLHPRESRIVTLGVQLDGAGEDSALLFIAGSHTKAQDVCAIAAQHGYDGDGVVLCPVALGDILLHDVMTVHASKPLRSYPQRRTLYIEFRSAAYALGNPGFSAQWVALRQQLFVAAQQLYTRVHCAGQETVEYTADEEALIDAVYNTVWRIEPGHYCFATK